MSQQTQERSSPRPAEPSQTETKAKDQRPTAKTKEEWDKILDDVDEALAEMEVEYESAEQFVKEFRNKGGE